MENKKKVNSYICLVFFISLVYSLLTIVSTKTTYGGPLSHIDETYIDMSFSVKDIIAIWGGTIVISVLIHIIRTCLVRFAHTTQNRKTPWVTYAMLMILMVFCWMPYLLTFVPGGVWADTVDSIAQCLVNTYRNHHPILYTLSWKALIHFFGTRLHLDWIWVIEAYVIIQTLMLSFACSYMLIWMYENGVHIVLIVASLVYICVFNNFPLYALSLWKDTPFACVFIIYVCTIGDLSLRPECINNKKWIIKYVVTTVLLMFTRNNGIYIVIATSLICLLYCFRKKVFVKRYLTVTLLSIIVYFIITGPVYGAIGFKNADNREESYGIMLQQMGYIVSDDSSNISQEEREILNNILSIDKWKEVYTPADVDSIKWSEDFDHEYFNNNIGTIRKCYISLCTKNFKKAVEAYLLATMGFWDIGKQSSHGYVVLDNWGLSELGDVKYNALKSLLGIDLSTKLRPVHYVSSAIFLWLYLFLGLIIVGIRKSNAIPLVPGYVLWATIMIATPVAFHHRYIIGVVFTMPVAVAMLDLSRKESYEENKI